MWIFLLLDVWFGCWCFGVCWRVGLRGSVVGLLECGLHNCSYVKWSLVFPRYHCARAMLRSRHRACFMALYSGFSWFLVVFFLVCCFFCSFPGFGFSCFFFFLSCGIFCLAPGQGLAYLWACFLLLVLPISSRLTTALIIRHRCTTFVYSYLLTYPFFVLVGFLLPLTLGIVMP